MPLQNSESHEVDIQLSPEEGNYGSTMFEDRHRQSFEESRLESLNPLNNKPSPEENKEIGVTEVLVEEKQQEDEPVV